MAINHKVTCPSCNNFLYITSPNDADIERLSKSSQKKWYDFCDVTVDCPNCEREIYVDYSWD